MEISSATVMASAISSGGVSAVRNQVFGYVARRTARSGVLARPRLAAGSLRELAPPTKKAP